MTFPWSNTWLKRTLKILSNTLPWAIPFKFIRNRLLVCDARLLRLETRRTPATNIAAWF